jgi:hypothetical protein
MWTRNISFRIDVLPLIKLCTVASEFTARFSEPNESIRNVRLDHNQVFKTNNTMWINYMQKAVYKVLVQPICDTWFTLHIIIHSSYRKAWMKSESTGDLDEGRTALGKVRAWCQAAGFEPSVDMQRILDVLHVDPQQRQPPDLLNIPAGKASCN